MARRGAEDTFRSSTQIVAEQQFVDTSKPLEQTVAEIGKAIIRENQQAKINESFSQSQLELSELSRQYQSDFQSDPFGGIDEYKRQRDAIFERNGKGISPFFKKPWQDSTRQLGKQDDATTKVWAFGQTKKNTVTSINTSIKNNLNQASIDGASFGLGEQGEISTMLNFATSKAKLIEYADENLGEAAALDMFESYDDDYLKMFLSGVSQTNPLRASSLMEDDDIKNRFQDHTEYLDMKKSVDTRALNVSKIKGQEEILGVLRNENAFLTKSLTEPASYAEIKVATQDMSKFATDYFMKANGYSSKAGSKLSAQEKIEAENQIFDEMVAMSRKEDVTSKDIKSLQDKIYKAANDGAITGKKTAQYINDFVSPAIAQQEEALSEFSIDNPRKLIGFFRDQGALGFGGLEEALNDALIEPDEDGNFSEQALRFNNEARLNMNTFYSDELRKEADVRGVSIGELSTLDNATKREIYTKAQNEAKWLFWSNQFPEIQSMKENPPASIVDRDGKKINTGMGSGSPSSSISVDGPALAFNTVEEAVAAGLPKGTKITIGGRLAEIN